MLRWMIKTMHSSYVFGQDEYFKDQIILYNGLYGTPAYFVWYAAPDKTRKIYMGLLLTLSLYRKKDDIVYADRFLVRSVDFDVKTQMYRIVARQITFELLNRAVALPYYELTSNKDKPLDGIQTLQILLSLIGNTKLEYQINIRPKIGYVGLSFDRETSILDVITKICAENRWEWYIKENKLFVSNAFSIEGAYIKGGEPEGSQKKEIDQVVFRNIILDADACEPGALYGEKGKESRVIWVKFYLGGELGSMMSVCLCRYLNMYISEDDYINTLTDLTFEKAQARMFKMLQSDPILVGKIFGEFKSYHLDKYESPIFSGDIENLTKDLNTRTFQTKYQDGLHGNLFVKNTKMTTPYAGNRVGLLFPQDESHRVLFTPEGDREVALVGPAYFGANERIPKRDSEKDFRLQLPGGWCLYVKENNEMFLRQEVSDNIVPLNTGTRIVFDSNGNIQIDGNTEITIGGAGATTLSKSTHSHPVGNMGIPVASPTNATQKLKGA